MFSLKQKIFGLDIGKRSIKGAVITKKGKDLFLEDYLYFDLQESSGPPTDDKELEAILTALVDGVGLKNQLVATTIEDKEVQLLSLSLPSMSKADLESAIQNEVESKTGLTKEEVGYDYLVTGQTVSGGVQETHITVFHSKLETIKRQLSLLENAHLQAVSIENSLSSILASLKYNDYIDPHHTSVIVDIGESHTSLGLVAQGEIQQMNVLRVGTGDINSQLMQRFQCSYQESELMKINYKLEREDSGTNSHLNRIVDDGYYQIILGIHDTVTYYKAAFKDQVIMNVILTGGGSQKDGLSNLIQHSLNMPIIVANPLRKIQIFSDKEQDETLPKLIPFLHSAIGLALRGVA